MKVKNEAGEEIEVPTQEEIDALAEQRAQEAAQRAKEEAEADKAELEEKIKKLEDKEYNFNQLRNKKDKESEESKKLASEIEALKQQIGEVKQQPFQKAKEDFIAVNNIAGDKELKEKFDFFFEPLAEKAKTEADYRAALTGAFAAATGGTRQPSFEGMMVGTRTNPPTSSAKADTEAGRHFAKVFGNSEDDRKKYGKNK